MKTIKATLNQADKETREVSDLNAELFAQAKIIFDENHGYMSHMGWCHVSVFIDWLEANYDMSIKPDRCLDCHGHGGTPEEPCHVCYGSGEVIR